MSFKRIAAAFAAACGLTLIASPADAAFRLRITSGATVVDVFDEGVGDDATGDTTKIVFDGVVGDYQVEIDTAITNQPDGTGLVARLTNNVVVERLTAGASDTIEFLLTATGYNFPGAPDTLTSNVTALASDTDAPAGDGAAGSLDAQSWLGRDNLEFEMDVTTGPQTIGPPLPPAGLDSATPVGFPPLTDLYSLTNRLILDIDDIGGQVTGDIVTEVTGRGGNPGPIIPEPSSIALLSLGGLGLAGRVIRRRRMAKAEAA